MEQDLNIWLPKGLDLAILEEEPTILNIDKQLAILFFKMKGHSVRGHHPFHDRVLKRAGLPMFPCKWHERLINLIPIQCAEVGVADFMCRHI